MQEIDLEEGSIKIMLDKRKCIYIHYESGSAIKVVSEHGTIIVRPSSGNAVIVEVDV